MVDAPTPRQASMPKKVLCWSAHADLALGTCDFLEYAAVLLYLKDRVLAGMRVHESCALNAWSPVQGIFFDSFLHAGSSGGLHIDLFDLFCTWK